MIHQNLYNTKCCTKTQPSIEDSRGCSFIFFTLALDLTIYTVPVLKGALYSSTANSSRTQK